MKPLSVRETALVLIFIFLTFCVVSNDDLQQAELAQNLAVQVRGSK